MKKKRLLAAYLVVMAALVAVGFAWPGFFTTHFKKPELYVHAKFVHILFVTLLFGNAVIGTLWELRGLRSGKTMIVRHTYDTVSWLDAVFTAPLIIVSVMSGIMLGTILGGVMSIGWIAAGFSLFALTGVVWVAADIPNQYRLNRALSEEPAEGALSPHIARLVWRRMLINVLGIGPLLVVFYLMVHKPHLPFLDRWIPPGPTPVQLAEDRGGTPVNSDASRP